MYKYAYLGGLSLIEQPYTITKIEKVETNLLDIFKDAQLITEYGGAKSWIVDLTPVEQFKFGYNPALKIWMIWADKFSTCTEARKIIYTEMEKRFPGLINRVRNCWDVRAKEVSGL